MALSEDIEYKICIICTEPCDEHHRTEENAVDVLNLEDTLKSVFGKLQVPYDECLAINLCYVCTTELSVTSRFIKKIEEAQLKIRDLLGTDLSQNGPSRSSSLENISIKHEHENKSPEQNLAESEGIEEEDYSEIPTHDSFAESASEEDKFVHKNIRSRLRSDTQPKRCCGCKTALTSNEQVQIHSKKRHIRDRITEPHLIKQQPFECSVCFERFQDKKGLLRHQRTMYAEELFPCRRCPVEFANAYNLRMHEKSFHRRTNTNAQIDDMRLRIHKCCICREQFDSLDHVKEHVMQNHPLQGENIETENEFECEICSRCFKTQKVLVEHQRRPFRKHRFQCSHCGKTFNERQAFSDHEQSHASVRPYECPICQKRFSLKTNFRTHVRYHTVPDDQFKCEFCGRGFKKKHLLQEHQVIHQESEVRPFKCHLCSIAFTRNDLLEFHVKEHLGEKPFKCKLCSASYIHGRDLRRHNRTKHEGQMPFVCEVCHKEFARKDAFGKHMKIHKSKQSNLEK
ncbi:AAEL003692-PA [Aedes aegypti]|uniref:AAEL003692-PA n=1 Tax=Aedes aegypti TaxID=7159 RepID=Q17ES7_AEDAE|nr:AAEL003692-PA [Aedes aegypti]